MRILLIALLVLTSSFPSKSSAQDSASHCLQPLMVRVIENTWIIDHYRYQASFPVQNNCDFCVGFYPDLYNNGNITTTLVNHYKVGDFPGLLSPRSSSDFFYSEEPLIGGTKQLVIRGAQRIDCNRG